MTKKPWIIIEAMMIPNSYRCERNDYMNFKALEQKLGVSAPEMARITHMSRSMYYAVRGGKRSLSTAMRRATIRHLAVHMNYKGFGDVQVWQETVLEEFTASLGCVA